LDELDAHVEARRRALRQLLDPHHLDPADDLAAIGQEQLQLEAVADCRALVGVEPHAALAHVGGAAAAEERLAHGPTEDRGIDAGELAPIHAVSVAEPGPRVDFPLTSRCRLRGRARRPAAAGPRGRPAWAASRPVAA